MKKQAINSFIKNKINHWLNTLPEELRKEVSSHIIVTGGCISSLFLDEVVNDYDVYFDSVSAAKKIVDFYIAQSNLQSRVNTEVSKRGILYVNVQDSLIYAKTQTNPYHVVSISKNAITLSDNIQLIVKHIGSPEYITSFYDFIHVCNYYTHKNERLILVPEALESIISQNLIYKGGKYPIASLFRVRKFLHRGWDISPGELTKIAANIAKLDLTKAKVLDEQLIGLNLRFFEKVKQKTQEMPLFDALCALSDVDDISPTAYIKKQIEDSGSYYRPGNKHVNKLKKRVKKASAGSYYRHE